MQTQNPERSRSVNTWPKGFQRGCFPKSSSQMPLLGGSNSGTTWTFRPSSETSNGQQPIQKMDRGGIFFAHALAFVHSMRTSRELCRDLRWKRVEVRIMMAIVFIKEWQFRRGFRIGVIPLYLLLSFFPAAFVFNCWY